MSRLRFCLQILFAFGLFLPTAFAQERPTFNHHTADPRPDILPYWLTSWHADYRRQYNRPRNITGRIVHFIEPTSQEAMVWCEAKQMGLYDTCQHPPVYKSYQYPKPWEVLQIGPRPDFKKPSALQPTRPSYSNVQKSNSQKVDSDNEASPSDDKARRELSQQSSRKSEPIEGNIDQ